jgi:protein-tyrosine phosphatase
LSAWPGGATLNNGGLRGLVDIHAHVLPGIDDGPSDLSESLRMAEAAAAAGIEVLAATPHLRADFPDVHIDELAERCRAVQDAIAAAGIPVELACGTEAALIWAVEAGDQDLRLATYRQQGSDLLIETPSGPVLGLDHLLYEIRSHGIRVTLAHPERSTQLQQDLEPIRRLVHQGILLQVNAGSLLANRRSGVRQLAERLCREGLAHALASDGHRGTSWRPVTKLADGVAALAELVGPERARWMASDAPRAIVNGTELPAAPPVESVRRRRWFFAKS